MNEELNWYLDINTLVTKIDRNIKFKDETLLIQKGTRGGLVLGDFELSDDSWLGQGSVSSNCSITGESFVGGNSNITDSIIEGSSKVLTDCVIKGTTISGNSTIVKSNITNSKIFGLDSFVYSGTIIDSELETVDTMYSNITKSDIINTKSFRENLENVFIDNDIKRKVT